MSKQVRKQVYDLVNEDFDIFPVWEFCFDEESEEDQDEATVRPYTGPIPLDSLSGMFVMKAKFTFANGQSVRGYVYSPVQGDSSIDTLQPTVITASGQVSFWHGMIKPKRERLDEYYTMLNMNADSVFPLAFESLIDVLDYDVSGIVDGYLMYEDWPSTKIEVVT